MPETTTLRVLLAELDRVSTPDESRCPACGTKVHKVVSPRDSWWADERGNAQCSWDGGMYGHQNWHGSGWTDTDEIEDVARAVVVAGRSLPAEVLDLEVTDAR